MSSSLFFTLLVALINPKPILLQSIIDSAKIIGLPRLKTMDKIFSTKVWVGTFEDDVRYKTYSRMKFLNDYIRQGKDS
jgi:hypothetical protein